MNSLLATSFASTSLGTMLGDFLGVIGLLVVIMAIVRVVQHVAKGDIAKAVKSVFGAIVLAAFLFQPFTLIPNAIGVGSDIVNAVIGTASSIAGGNGSSVTPAPGSGSTATTVAPTATTVPTLTPLGSATTLG